MSSKKIFLFSFVFLFLVLSLLTFRPNQAEAKTVTVKRNYGHGWWRTDSGCRYNWAHYRKSNRWICSGNVSVTHRVTKNISGNTFNVGQNFNFSYNPTNPYFTGWGGAWDTPYGRWCSSINSACFGRGNIRRVGQRINPVAGGWYGYVMWTAVKPSVYISSSNSSVVRCSGMKCAAVGPGTTRLTAHIGKTRARIWSYIQNRQGWWWPSEEGSYLHPDALYIHCEHPGNILDYANRNTMNLPSASVYWDVKVNTLSPSVDLRANPITINYNSSATLSWTSSNANSCSASGDWSGSKSTSGSESTGNLTSSKRYTITCSGPGGTASDSVTVNVASPVLSASLSASPSSGNAPLPVTMTATVSGTAVGNVDYTFWRDCNSSCHTVSSCRSSCGNWSAQYRNQSSTSKSYSTSYPSAGSYVAKVVTERNGLSAEGRANITVNVPPPPPTVDIKAMDSDGQFSDNPSINYNASTTIKWTSTKANSCTASGDWSGSKSTSGSEPRSGLTTSKTYTITCSGNGGTASDSVTVTVRLNLPHWREVTP